MGLNVQRKDSVKERSKQKSRAQLQAENEELQDKVKALETRHADGPLRRIRAGHGGNEQWLKSTQSLSARAGRRWTTFRPVSEQRSRPYWRKTMSRLREGLLKFLLRKEVDSMAVVYATLIIKGRKTIEQVPALIREQVKEILADCEVEVKE